MPQQIASLRGNYEKYLKEKAEREAQHLAAYNNQQREIAHLEDFVRRFRAKASKATQAQARLKQLEKIERIAPPQSVTEQFTLSFPSRNAAVSVSLHLIM